MSADVIIDSCISTIWVRALAATANRPSWSLNPLLVSLCIDKSGVPAENPSVRLAVDEALTKYRCYTVAITASLIFPYRRWKREARSDRSVFFAWYLKQFLPRLKARARANRYGTYFERMIAFSGVRNSTRSARPVVCNQLDHIIADWHRPRKRPRRPRQSALQAACFDPVKDHTGQALRGFPCLQQIGFCYDNSGGLAVNAYYPTEYIFDRGYGNYLGLCHLGMFMAHELGLRLTRLNCYVGQPLLGRITKTSARTLEAKLIRLLDQTTSGNTIRISRGPQ
jgi:hypothetical protein